ncbi:MAG: hypothetical protein K2O62_00345, partial [Clostridia bacterium]|nr:hypothetical protein [Clostridia bacterium]
YMQAELLDKTNFELDKTVTDVVGAPYTTPAKELSTGEKIVNILKTYWLYIVIALVVLIVLILAIVLGTRSAKRRREREERKEEERLAREERKEEERRQREEDRRREEREERMARISQPQMQMPQIMPQMMPQMMGQMMGQQQMPQSQPAQAQPVATGGGSSLSEAMFMQMQAEFATMKAEQAAMRAEQTARALTEQQIAQAKTDMQLANILNRLGGEQTVQGGIGGVSMQALTELVEATVKKVMAGEKSAAQPAAPEGAATAATQVPPDAVMTTVTTTKIDTTKKPAQNAQAAPARTVVRNVVAPMPVDDGRVFDVGGFYKPADPMTDMGEEENKD